jgi:hypothetical protein
MADPQKYRDKAARLRREAEAAKDPTIKHALFRIADQYDSLARSVEATQRGPA